MTLWPFRLEAERSPAWSPRWHAAIFSPNPFKKTKAQKENSGSPKGGIARVKSCYRRTFQSLEKGNRHHCAQREFDFPLYERHPLRCIQPDITLTRGSS